MITPNIGPEAVIRRKFLKNLGVTLALATTGSANAFSYIFESKDGNVLTIAQCLIAGNIVNSGYQNTIKKSLGDIYAFLRYTPTYVEVQISKKREWLENNPEIHEKISETYQWDKNIINLIMSLHQLKYKITASMSYDEKRQQGLA